MSKTVQTQIVLTKLPALESNGVSEFVVSRIRAIENARKVYIEAEHSECLRRALRLNVRNAKQHFQVGDCVFYRRFGR